MPGSRPNEAAAAVVTERSKILNEARGLVDGDRQADYGPPSENFSNIAVGWSILLGTDVTPAQVALCMAWLKLARTTAGYKRDTAVDLAGYAALYGELSEIEIQGGGD